MHLNTWKTFRHEIYGCLLRAEDALFNTVDALMTETQATSLPEVTQSLWFERKWPSIYEAFEDGRIDQHALREVFVRYVPAEYRGRWLWVGVDTTGIARPKARTARDRSALPVHNLPECEKPITWGWQFSTVVVLPDPTSSWTYILDQQRVDTETTPAQVAFAQVQQLSSSLPQEAVVVLDRGYNAIWLWCQCSTLPFVGTLIRLKANRCFYRAAPPKSGQRGAPRKDGAKLQPDDETTHGSPDGTWQGPDAKDRPVTITWWKQVHAKQARWLELTVLRVVRPHASNTERDPRVSWFVWIGDASVDLVSIALGYVCRFGQEHGYRFDKQALLWEKAHLRTPEQFERWSLVVAMAHNQLVLARSVVEPELRPWENRQRLPTPQHVRRGIGKFLPRLGTPARPVQPRGKSPGRSKAVKMGKAKQFSVVRKTSKLPPLVPI
jgi:hypothetical protein